MNYEIIKNILLKYFTFGTTKRILSNNGFKPSYSKMLLMWKNDGIPLEAWENIRLFCGRDYYENGVLKSDRSRSKTNAKKKVRMQKRKQKARARKH